MQNACRLVRTSLLKLVLKLTKRIPANNQFMDNTSSLLLYIPVTIRNKNKYFNKYPFLENESNDTNFATIDIQISSARLKLRNRRFLHRWMFLFETIQSTIS